MSKLQRNTRKELDKELKRPTKPPSNIYPISSFAFSGNKVQNVPVDTSSINARELYFFPKPELSITEDTYKSLKLSGFSHGTDVLNGLKNIYEFLNCEKVEDYLINNEILLNLLKDIYDEIINYFNPRKVLLEVLDEFDSSDPPSLAIRINTSDDVDSVLKKQEEFNSSYWLNVPLNTTRNVIIDFDFE
jgi:hypothetical protein